VGKGIDAYAYDRAAPDRVGAVQTPIVRAAYQQYGRIPYWGSGTYGNHLATVLRKGFQINAQYRGGQSPKSATRAVSAQRPLIVLVQWGGGGGHWVVVVGRTARGLGKASDYRILDPAGHVVVNHGSTTYRPPYGGTGTFASYYVAIQGRLPMPRGRKSPGT
jgi:hypothetical protein